MSSDEKSLATPKRPARINLILLIATICIAIVSATGLVVILKHYTKHSKDPTSTLSLNFCGNDAKTASAAGCKFDPISFSWTPQPCYDAQLIDDFLNLDTWKWYSDANGTGSVDFNEVMAGTHDYLYVSWDYHRWHCTYMWRKMHRAILSQTIVGEKKLLLDTYINDPEHTDHCEEVLLNRTVALTETSTMIRRKFVACASI